jgi:spore coat polysaccharide biosynthesis protein SpsF
MKHVVILQARTTSARLPGKALLPVAGYPSAVLAALRAANTGSDVIVATSDEPSDDALVAELLKHKIRVVRGSLHDVLGRFHQAAYSLPDNCIVVRLTGDNVVPDGQLVQELALALDTSQLDYLSQASPQSRLPYGLGGEAFRVATLQKAHVLATSAFDREHVGSWMRRNHRSGIHTPISLGTTDFSHLRCTIDDQQDYERVRSLFEGVIEPLRTSWWDLLQKLTALPGEPSFRIPYRIFSGRVVGELTLGTAQLGMKYGVANRTGQPPREVATAIVRGAIAHGVTTIDTARGYGDSEEVLREALSGAWRSRVEIITKLDPLASLAADADASSVEAAVDASVRRSCLALGTTELTSLLLHRWQHRGEWGGSAWRRLLDLREQGIIGSLGVSVYDPKEALQALEDPDIQHLQIPFNVLDHRWRSSGIDQLLAGRRDVTVYARSVFLQGVLLGNSSGWPRVGGYDPRCYVGSLRNLAKRFERRNVADLCVAYVRAQDWLCSLVVGCETSTQLRENLDLFRLPVLTPDQCNELERALFRAPEALLNPSRWNDVYGKAEAQ